MSLEFTDSSIRRASALDVPIITDIIRKSFLDVAKRFNLTELNCPKHPSNCCEHWIIDALKKGIRYYLLEAEGRPCGCVALEHANSEVCYLERLAVLPYHRQRGYGRTLVGHVVGEARGLGVQRIDIGIIAGQTELRDWYRQIGFEETRRATFDHLPFEALFMSMNI